MMKSHISLREIVIIAILFIFMPPLKMMAQTSPSLMIIDFENKYKLNRVSLTDAKPKMLTEGDNHLLSLDRGLPHTGLRSVLNQKQRADIYRNYVNQAIESPVIVGAHWFQFSDQVYTGRNDGENYQIGFVDICDRPYPGLVAASRRIGSYLYNYRSTGIIAVSSK